MKKIKTALIALSCLFLVGGGLTACNPEDPTPIVTISNGETATLEVGETLQLNVTKEHTDDAITYTSSNNEVATVSDTGLVTAVAKGEATITAEAGDITDTIKITVTEAVVPPDPVVEVESVTLNKTEITLEAGATETLTATVLPENATDKTVTWETSNAEVATVANGVVTAVAKGEATITAKAGEKSATCKVTVNEPAPAYLTIAEAKEKSVGETITVRGEVTAVSGKSAYIADETGGFYVYNWSYNGDDTAIVDGSWVLGMDVEVHGKIAEFSNLIQISNWDDARIEGTYAIEIEDEVTPMTPIALTEEGYKALTEKDAGNLYKFTAEYVSGTPSTGNNVSTTWKLGSTNITLRTDKYDKVGIDETFVAGDVYEITTPLSWYGSNPQFAFLGTGTVLDKQIIPLESLSLTASKTEAVVGEIVTLTATKTPSNANGEVRFNITSDENQIATLDGNELTASGVGIVKVQASIGEALSNEVSITFVAPSQHGTATYTMSKGWESITLGTDNPFTAAGTANWQIVMQNAQYTEFTEIFNGMTDNSAGVVKNIFAKGQVYAPKSTETNAGLLVGTMNRIYGMENYKDGYQPFVKFETLHEITSVTLTVIPVKVATQVSITLNSQQINTPVSNSEGTINSKMDIKFDLETPATSIEFSQDWIQNNQFGLIGMTLEW